MPSCRMPSLAGSIAVIAGALMTAPAAAAQELEPGLYLNAPTGMNAAAFNYSFSKGDVVVDASLPVEGLHARVHVFVVGYVRTFDFFGRAAKWDVLVPVSRAAFEGEVAGELRTRSPSGLADPRVRLAVNLLGSPALGAQEFSKYTQATILGASLQVALPLGQYDKERLINLGAHRWSFRPEVALSHRRSRWVLEVAAGAWLFTENGDYFGHTTLGQRPLYFVKGNLIYTFRRNLWTSVSYGHAEGGETSVGGRFRNDFLRSDRMGATFAVPVTRSSSLRFAYVSGLTTRLGGDFDSLAVGYQYSWR